MELNIVALPFRTSDAPQTQDMVGILSTYVTFYEECELNARACLRDFQRIQALRLQCASIATVTSITNCTSIIEAHHEYYHCIEECETKFQMNQQLPVPHVSSSSHGGSGSGRSLEWTSPLIHERQMVNNLAEERATIIWNLVCFETLQASQLLVSSTLTASPTPSTPTPTTTSGGASSASSPNELKAMWSQASQHYKNGANWLQHMPANIKEDYDRNGIWDFSTFLLELWQAALMAASQQCLYESVKSSSKGRPKHVLMAKLAAAASTLWGQVGTLLVQQQQQQQQKRWDSSVLTWESLLDTVTTTSTSSTSTITNSASTMGDGSRAKVLALWEQHSQAYHMYMTSIAEYHQAMVHGEKKQLGMQIARLNRSLQCATNCAEFCQGINAPPSRRTVTSTKVSIATTPPSTIPLLSEFGAATILPCLDQLRTFLEEAIYGNFERQESVPTEFPDIRGEQLVKIDQPLQKLLRPMKGAALFQVNGTLPASQGEYEMETPHHQQQHHEHQQQPQLRMQQEQQQPQQHHHHQQRQHYEDQNGVGSDLPVNIIAATGSHADNGNHIARQPKQQQSQEHRQRQQEIGQQQQRWEQEDEQQLKGQHEQDQQLMVHVEKFRHEMDRRLQYYVGMANDRTEAARASLSMAHLPHSLTAFEQEQSGGGIPLWLWEKVEAIQNEQQIPKLKQALWELRDMSETARSHLRRVRNELDSDLESDRLYRLEQPHFQGRDVSQQQRPCRQSLGNFERVLASAQEGDMVILQRLEQLNTNPKYKLLQFRKTELDRLLPSVNHDGENGGFDTARLSRYLVELSTLLNKRQSMLQHWQSEYERYDIESKLENHYANNPAEWNQAMRHALSSFDPIIFELQSNLDSQSELMDRILAENDEFVKSRTGARAPASDSCLAVIEDAIEDVEQLWTHLKEGTGFYDALIPKMERLREEVGDLSARLTVERLEYDEQNRRSQQEYADAEMAKRMASPDDQNLAGNGGSNALQNGNAFQSVSSGNPPMYSGVGMDSGSYNPYSVPPTPPTGPQSFQPSFDVNGTHSATLVAMGFDAFRVTEALRIHNNDVDRALNALLSG